METLQKRIKDRRNLLNLTLLDIAKQLEVTEATVQRYESGKIKNIKYDMIVRISKILQCTPQYLMGWSEYVTEPQYNNINAKIDEDENQEMILEFIRILKKLSPKDKIKLMSIIYDFEEKLNF